MSDHERTASLMTPGKLAEMKPKAAASPAAWLDQMASDVGHLHVKHLAELRAELQAQAAGRLGAEALEGALGHMLEALRALDFDLLQPKGWFARATGKTRSAGAEFAAQAGDVGQAADAVKAHAQQLAKAQHADAPAAERTLVELEMEWRALEKILDQGARWLQDMRNQLKTRQAASPDEAAQQQIREDAARCEVLVARLKWLRSIAAAAQHAHQQAQAALARRASVVQAAQQLVAGPWKAWESRMAPITSAAADSGSTVLSLEGPKEAHRELLERLQQAQADCAQLAQQDGAVRTQVAALDEQLRTAA